MSESETRDTSVYLAGKVLVKEHPDVSKYQDPRELRAARERR